MRTYILTVVTTLLLLQPAFADDEIVIVSWNVESGGADPDTIKARIASFSGVDIWGFSEVRNTSWSLKFEDGAEDGEGGDFKPILGNTGGADRLLIVFDKDQFEEIDTFEIDWTDRYWFRPTMSPRSALVAHLRLISTGQEFMFMVNHLYRGNGVDPRRLDQAKALREWASQQTVPVIAVGDYNFDWDLDPNETQFNTQKGFGDMTACGTFVWLQPATLITTHDSSFNSILDFVFLAQSAGVITGTSRVIVEAGDFPDTNDTPDHRPVEATLTFID